MIRDSNPQYKAAEDSIYSAYGGGMPFTTDTDEMGQVIGLLDALTHAVLAVAEELHETRQADLDVAKIDAAIQQARTRHVVPSV